MLLNSETETESSYYVGFQTKRTLFVTLTWRRRMLRLLTSCRLFQQRSEDISFSRGVQDRQQAGAVHLRCSGGRRSN